MRSRRAEHSSPREFAAWFKNDVKIYFSAQLDAHMKRIDWLDTAKGISILLVVFWHAIMATKSAGFVVSPVYALINAPLLLIRMPLFFSASGMVIGGRPKLDKASFFLKRIWTPLWLYVLWTIIYVIAQHRPVEQLIEGIYDPRFHLWFIWALLTFRTLVWLLDDVKLIATLFALPVAIFGFMSTPDMMSMAHTNVLQYAFFFFVSYWYGRPIAEIVTKYAPWAMIIGLTAVAVFWKTEFWFGVAIGGVLGGFGLSKIIADNVPPLYRMFTFLGRHSLEIFILHFMLVGPLTRVSIGFPGATYWSIPFVTCAAITISIVFRKITRRFLPWLFEAPMVIHRSLQQIRTRQ
jgi:surface polysaccharide O-acyltransferase-like enzyme